MDVYPVSDTPQERSLIEETCLDYIIGWYDSDRERMRRSLHPDLAKDSLAVIDGELSLAKHTADSLVDLTGRSEQQAPDDRRADVRILAVHGHMAAAEVVSASMVDLLHLVRMPDGWRIVHALWGLDSGELLRR